jgi:outer membrane protein assembly factor BamA
VAYGTYRPVRWLASGASGGRLDRPVLEAPTGPFDRDYPDARFMFADESAFALQRQPSFAHGRASVTADTRNYPDHASRGGLYEIAWARYADLDLSRFSFTRYEAEAAHFVPFFQEGLVLAFHAWAVASDTAEGQSVPVYLMPGLGGGNMLRAYPNFRFHDRNLLVGTAEARVALSTHLDIAAFMDSGSVAAEVEDLRLANHSYGLGVRVHTHKSTAVRLDAAHGREGWRMSFSLSDPFRLKRLVQHTATVPFVP